MAKCIKQIQLNLKPININDDILWYISLWQLVGSSLKTFCIVNCFIALYNE